MIRRILKESFGISQLLTCTSWLGIAKKKRFSMCREYGFTLWENPDLEASKKHNPGPKSWETWTSRGQQCRNEAFEWIVVCSHGEEESVYVLENESEKSSCWMKVVGSEQVVFHSFWSNLNENERTHTRRFAYPEPIFLHFTCRLMHPFGEILSPFGMDIYLFWMVMLPFFD